MKLSPDSQFIPTRDNVSAILDHYDLGLVAYHEASSGIENRTLIAETDKGKRVIRIYRQRKKPTESIHLELDFMAYLQAHGIKIPRVIQSKEGEQVTVLQLDDHTWQIIVMEYIEGRHAKAYSKVLLREMADIQARTHSLSGRYKGDLKAAKRLTSLRGAYWVAQVTERTTQTDRLRELLTRVENYVVELPMDMPTGLCHLDYDKENTLTENGAVSAILDFDDLAVAPFVACLAYTLWSIYVEAGEAAVRSYLDQYESVQKLSDTEYRYIGPAMLYRHYAITAIKVIGGHTSPKEIAEYIRIENALTQLAFNTDS